MAKSTCVLFIYVLIFANRITILDLPNPKSVQNPNVCLLSRAHTCDVKNTGRRQS